MKKFICTALTLAMVVGSLAGCGSSSSKETTAASGAATEAATEAAQTGPERSVRSTSASPAGRVRSIWCTIRHLLAVTSLV